MLNKVTDITKRQGNQTAIVRLENLNNEVVNWGTGFLYVFSSSSTATCSRFERKSLSLSDLSFGFEPCDKRRWFCDFPGLIYKSKPLFNVLIEGSLLKREELTR